MTITISKGNIGRIFDEMKGRPLYIVRPTYGIDGRKQQIAANLRAEPSNSKR
jgi:hypothetical protein